MTVTGNVIAETGLDLNDPKLASRTLAPLLADRLVEVFPAFSGAREAVAAIMTAYKGLTASSGVLGAVGAAVSAIGAAAGYLEGRLDNDIADNAKRWETARNKTIARWIAPGDWSTAVFAGGLPVGKVDLKNQIGGWDESDFLAQYNEGIVWMSHRTAKSDILLPTWESPPFTNGYGFMSADKGVTFPEWSPLSGFSVGKRYHRIGQPRISSIPKKYDATYFGTMPAATLVELKDAGLEGAPKFLQRLIVKMEAAYFNQAFIPPPDYTYLFSVGTYPYTSWTTANNGMPGPNQTVTLNTTMAAIAAGIHSLTPLHALVRSVEVEQCYRHWLACTRLRSLPRVPKGQVDAGVYLDGDDLPWSPTPFASITTVQPANPKAPPPKYEWEKEAAKRCLDDPSLATTINSGCYPKGLAMNVAITWEAARAVELAFRSFFKIRRAALFQMNRTTAAFREAAANSRDPVMAAAARGKPPAYKAWSPSDPLGDGWNDSTEKDVGVAPKASSSSPTPKARATAAAVTPEVTKLAIVAGTGLVALGYSERARLRAWGRRLVRRVRSRQSPALFDPQAHRGALLLAGVATLAGYGLVKLVRRWRESRILSEVGYTSGRPFSISVVTIDGKPVEIETANAFKAMREAARAQGVKLQVVSGFRTMSEQRYLYKCYLNCDCNNCNFAVKPGYSNHQSGSALDLNTRGPGVLVWLRARAAEFGFRETISSEPWHWEHKGT
jgi:hypothetical protein